MVVICKLPPLTKNCAKLVLQLWCNLPFLFGNLSKKAKFMPKKKTKTRSARDVLSRNFLCIKKRVFKTFKNASSIGIRKGRWIAPPKSYRLDKYTLTLTPKRRNFRYNTNIGRLFCLRIASSFSENCFRPCELRRKHYSLSLIIFLCL